MKSVENEWEQTAMKMQLLLSCQKNQRHDRKATVNPGGQE
jgi:hypothetical protein